MSNQLFNVVGLLLPLPATVAPPQGGETILMLKNTTAARLAGETVVLAQPGYADPLNPHEFRFDTVQQCQGPGVTAATLPNGIGFFGVLMTDAAIDEVVPVMVRGVLPAWCQQVVTACNRSAQPLMVAAIGIANASTAALGNDENVLSNPFDLATTETAKIVARYLDSTALNAGAGEGAKRLVLFNGIEGLGSWTKP